MHFSDRRDAADHLAARMEHLKSEDAVILGLPRGGVPVAAVIARRLDLPMDVIVVRKVGVPFRPELAMGAVGEAGVLVVNDDVVASLGIEQEEFDAVEQRERREVEARAMRFRGRWPQVPLAGRTAVLVDDGIATGSTMTAACRVARAAGASRVVVAAPVAPPATLTRIGREVDEVVCVASPRGFVGVGQWYRDFAPVSDEEVVALIDQARRDGDRDRSGAGVARGRGHLPGNGDADVYAGETRLAGNFVVPAQARGLVLFAHGSGSSRLSPRNRFVADVLNEAGFGTLLFDLLTPDEEPDRDNVFDIDLLAERLAQVTVWCADDVGYDDLPIGYFGASTGAAAALVAAARPDSPVTAVVSRGGRPDLAGERLVLVRAPTLLVVGGRDDVVLDLNRKAQRQLRCQNRLEIVPGATHLFEEPGALAAVADLATSWFVTHLRRDGS